MSPSSSPARTERQKRVARHLHYNRRSYPLAGKAQSDRRPALPVSQALLVRTGFPVYCFNSEDKLLNTKDIQDLCARRQTNDGVLNIRRNWNFRLWVFFPLMCTHSVVALPQPGAGNVPLAGTGRTGGQAYESVLLHGASAVHHPLLSPSTCATSSIQLETET